jgi:aminopeptidase-like protein
MGGHASVADLQMALLWVLNYADGLHGIDWIASRSKFDPKTVQNAADLLINAKLLANDS